MLRKPTYNLYACVAFVLRTPQKCYYDFTSYTALPGKTQSKIEYSFNKVSCSFTSYMFRFIFNIHSRILLGIRFEETCTFYAMSSKRLTGCMGAASPWRTLGIRSCRHFVQTWPDSECSPTVQFLDSAVLRL